MSVHHGDQFRTFLTTQLNNSQRTTVEHEKGPLLVIAGAGSGKTRIITARIAHLILNQGVAPSAIVALTFTNKAAREMKERITQFLGTRMVLPFVGTFHAYSIRTLKRYAERACIGAFSVLDEDDQLRIIRSIMQRMNLHKQLSPRNILYQISQAKNQLLQAHVPAHILFTHPMLHDVYRAYEAEKKVSRCFDFDDLLIEMLRLLKENSSIKQLFQQEIRHVLVDEYQDTNGIQHDLLCEMTKLNGTLVADSICAVGDEDQSIYSWRGATVANILNFTKDFPGTTIVKAEQNYRSVTPILSLANAIIENNAQRNPKALWSKREGVDRIRDITCLSEYQESETIALCIQTASKKYSRNDIAILYRTHVQSRAIEEALIKQAIPYRIVGGIAFYERREIRDLLAYLRLIVNPFDRPSFFRIINVPTRGLGQKFEEDIHAAWNEQPFLTFSHIIDFALNNQSFTGTKSRSLVHFLSIFHGLTPDLAPAKALEELITRTGYLTFLKDNEEPQEFEARVANVQELVDAARHFERQGINTVELFLQEVALMQDKAHETDDTQRVSLMTLHAAKGLEFDLVILPGLEESLLPSSRSVHDLAALEEERRLLYVGITRAREHLLITHAKYRYTYGTMVDQSPSRFLREMPRTLMTSDDITGWNSIKQQNYFEAWLTGRSLPITQEVSSCSVHNRTVSRRSPSDTHVQSQAATPAQTRFKINQPVHHDKYGTGIVQLVEQKADGSAYLTVKFKAGSKKILASFIRAI